MHFLNQNKEPEHLTQSYVVHLRTILLEMLNITYYKCINVKGIPLSSARVFKHQADEIPETCNSCDLID